jgi:molybdate transport system substrate-binding protein
MRRGLPFLLLLVASVSASAAPLTIVAASDLRYAMGAVIEAFRVGHPDIEPRVMYGSSGRFATQIENGAPFDLYFSADEAYPQRLHRAGLTAGAPQRYGLGRIVLWVRDGQVPPIAALHEPRFRRIAIANPTHAPYGERAQQALTALGLWQTVEPRLVLGENISQAAQMVYSGAAEIGVVALALVLGGELEGQGDYRLIDEALHQPLWQAFVITRRAADDARAQAFADFVLGEEGRSILARYGFVLPDE